MSPDPLEPMPASTDEPVEVADLRTQVAVLTAQLHGLRTGDTQVAAFAHEVVARQRAEEELARIRAQMEALTGPHEVRHVRLCDLHARFHDRPGDLVGASECDRDGCMFWASAAFVMDSLPSQGALRVA